MRSKGEQLKAKELCRATRREFRARNTKRSAGHKCSGLRAWASSGLSWFLSFVFCLLPVASPMAMQKTEDRSAMAAADFPKLADDYMLDLYSRHPNLAAATGIHAWDGQLEDYSAQGITAEVAAIKKFQSRLEKIPPFELGFSEIFDYQIIASNIKSRLLELEQIRSFA